MNADWPFPDPKNVPVFTTEGVVKGKRPILLVTHDAEDGAWQFHTPEKADRKPMVVSLFEIYQLDPTIGELADLPLGWQAGRDSVSRPWERWAST